MLKGPLGASAGTVQAQLMSALLASPDHSASQQPSLAFFAERHRVWADEHPDIQRVNRIISAGDRVCDGRRSATLAWP